MDEFEKVEKLRQRANISYEEAKEMVNSGLVEIQSHTYDMHQSYDVSGEGARELAIPHTKEQINDFKTVFKNDFKTYDDEYFKHFETYRGICD